MTEYTILTKSGPMALARELVRPAAKKPKKAKAAKTTLLSKAAQLPGVNPERLKRIDVLDEGLAKLDRLAAKGAQVDQAGRGVLAQMRNQQVLAAAEELATSQRGTVAAQRKATWPESGRPVGASAGRKSDEAALRAILTGEYDRLSPSPDQTLTSGQRQGQSDFDEILRATEALHAAHKSGDPVKVEQASFDLSKARLVAAHNLGVL